MFKKKFKFKAKVWIWPGEAGWHFVNLDKNLYKEIRSVYTKGFVKVKATCGKSEWNTSLFPHTKDGAYLLCLKKSIRKDEGIFAGDTIQISLQIL